MKTSINAPFSGSSDISYRSEDPLFMSSTIILSLTEPQSWSGVYLECRFDSKHDCTNYYPAEKNKAVFVSAALA